MPDYVAVVRTAHGRFILHAAFQFNYRQDVPRDMARYGGSLAWQYQTAVESVLVLLHSHGVPEDVPEEGHYTIGTTRTAHPFKVVRLWEIDPKTVLETNDPKLLPGALLMKSTDEQVRKIASIVARQGDDEALGRFLTLGTLRYDRNTLTEMLGGAMTGFERALVEGSWLFTEARDPGHAAGLAEGRDKGLAEGLAEWREEGRTEGARKLLRVALRAKFPKLENLFEIDQISSIDKLEALMEALFHATGSTAFHEVILAAAKPN